MTRYAARRRGPIAFAALAGIALLVSHDAVFFAQLGPGESITRALRDAGHAYWGLASVLLAAGGLAAALAAGLRIARLRREALRLDARPVHVARAWRWRLLIAWGRLFAVVAFGFAVQESLEHLAMHGHFIGLGALTGPEYPLALPVLAAISLIAAALGLLVNGTERALTEIIAAARRALERRAPRVVHAAVIRLIEPGIPLPARAAALRAPPRVLVGQA